MRIAPSPLIAQFRLSYMAMENDRTKRCFYAMSSAFGIGNCWALNSSAIFDRLARLSSADPGLCHPASDAVPALEDASRIPHLLPDARLALLRRKQKKLAKAAQ
jgi:hypothetical protein